MRNVIVNVGKKSYRCRLAETYSEMKKGLSNLDYLLPDEGMLFDYTNESVIPEMWMKNTYIPLDIIGINRDGEVNQVVTAEPESEELIPFPDSIFILEVNAGSKIKPGLDVEIDGAEDLDKYVMKILAPDGSTQGLLQGGERIFSRISTRKIISRAKKAYTHRANTEEYEKDCIKLGKYVFEELKAQDERKPEYVDVPQEK